jgi:hypothetical protein
LRSHARCGPCCCTHRRLHTAIHEATWKQRHLSYVPHFQTPSCWTTSSATGLHPIRPSSWHHQHCNTQSSSPDTAMYTHDTKQAGVHSHRLLVVVWGPSPSDLPCAIGSIDRSAMEATPTRFQPPHTEGSGTAGRPHSRQQGCRRGKGGNCPEPSARLLIPERCAMALSSPTRRTDQLAQKMLGSSTRVGLKAQHWHSMQHAGRHPY